MKSYNKYAATLLLTWVIIIILTQCRIIPSKTNKLPNANIINELITEQLLKVKSNVYIDSVIQYRANLVSEYPKDYITSENHKDVYFALQYDDSDRTELYKDVRQHKQQFIYTIPDTLKSRVKYYDGKSDFLDDSNGYLFFSPLLATPNKDTMVIQVYDVWFVNDTVFPMKCVSRLYIKYVMVGNQYKEVELKNYEEDMQLYRFMYYGRNPKKE